MVLGKTAPAIVEVARGRTADLIVMSSRGQSGAEGWVYGSIVDEMLRAAEQPVLLIGASGRERCLAAGPELE